MSNNQEVFDKNQIFKHFYFKLSNIYVYIVSVRSYEIIYKKVFSLFIPLRQKPESFVLFL